MRCNFNEASPLNACHTEFGSASSTRFKRDPALSATNNVSILLSRFVAIVNISAAVNSLLPFSVGVPCP